MRGVIIVNGYYRSESEETRCRRLMEHFALKNVPVTLYRNNIPFDCKNFSDVDFCLFFDKDVCLARLIEGLGIKVYNSSSVLEITDNKCLTYAFFEGKGIEMPATVPAPKKYFYAQDRSFLDAVSDRLGFPLVLKEGYGSLGKQVYLIPDRDSLYQTDEKTGVKDKLFQKFYGGSAGESVRIICIGQKAIGGMKLRSEGDFRSNAHQGGKGEAFPLPPDYQETAERIARLLQADYIGIDFFADRPVLIEVNGSAYFDAFERVTGIDVAEEYADYILKTFSP